MPFSGYRRHGLLITASDGNAVRFSRGLPPRRQPPPLTPRLSATPAIFHFSRYAAAAAAAAYATPPPPRHAAIAAAAAATRATTARLSVFRQRLLAMSRQSAAVIRYRASHCHAGFHRIMPLQAAAVAATMISPPRRRLLPIFFFIVIFFFFFIVFFILPPPAAATGNSRRVCVSTPSVIFTLMPLRRYVTPP